MNDLTTESARYFEDIGFSKLGAVIGSKLGKKIPHRKLDRILTRVIEGEEIKRDEAIYLTSLDPDTLPYLLYAASVIRDRGKGKTLTYSKNVFIPLTRLCRNHCGYCTFKIEPGDGELLMTPEEVVDMARKGASVGCTELLFVLGDKPELVYKEYRDKIRAMGFDTTTQYLAYVSRLGLQEGIFPHSNMGLATEEELLALKETNPSMGLMLENISDRLLRKGQAHHRCADKVPKLRMKTMEIAGRLRIPWTSGILVGIGETWEERIDSLYALKELSDRYGHIQEIIIQNFSPKDGIDMEAYPPPSFVDMLRTVAISRLIFGENMNIQIPPNLNNRSFSLYIYAGINDLGGVSPITIDYVNPEAPWPQIKKMEKEVQDLGFELKERLPVYPEFITPEFINENLLKQIEKVTDNNGYVMLGGRRYV